MPMPRDAFPFTAKLIAGAPEEPGVYVLWLEEQIIYIGHAAGGTAGGAATIRSCLVDHFSGANGPCTRRATHYSWELTLRAPAERERTLLAEYQTAHSHLPSCNARL